jgi:hypothetical protein
MLQVNEVEWRFVTWLFESECLNQLRRTLSRAVGDIEE